MVLPAPIGFKLQTYEDTYRSEQLKTTCLKPAKPSLSECNGFPCVGSSYIDRDRREIGNEQEG
mgnify:CR=1 FL=1